MRRREFILALAAAAAFPVAARAQKAIPVIAMLGSGAADTSSSRLQMTRLDAAMTELDLVTGRDYLLETRWAGSDASQFGALAAELLATNPRAVLVSINLAAFAVQKISRSVPIVGTGLNTPVAAGLAESLARPGGNITGVATMAEDLQLKLLEILRETLPAVRRVMAVANPTNPSTPVMLDVLIKQATRDGIAVDVANVAAPADLDAAFAQLARQPTDAVFVLTDNSLFGLAEPIVSRALGMKVPSFGSFSEPFAQVGGLYAYSRDVKEAYQGVARLLKKILAGASPAEIPFEQPTKFNLFVNLKTAKTLGIEVPVKLVAIADGVIE